MAEGIRWLVAHPPMRTLALTIFTFNVTFGASWSVLVLYAGQRLHMDAVGFGLLTTAAAVGAHFPSASRKVTVIPEAADVRFSPVRDAAAEAAWQTQLGIRPPYVLYLGQWKAYKNLPLLVQAFSAVRETHPTAQLVIAGDDPRHPEVREAAGRLPQGSVVFPGRVPESGIPDLYRAAAVVVLPSRAEGFGLPVIEAMACGVPIVCSDLPVLREVGNSTAIYCDPADASAFARAIASVLDSDGMPALRRRGIERASTFTWQKAAAQMSELFAVRQEIAA